MMKKEVVFRDGCYSVRSGKTHIWSTTLNQWVLIGDGSGAVFSTEEMAKRICHLIPDRADFVLNLGF